MIVFCVCVWLIFWGKIAVKNVRDEVIIIFSFLFIIVSLKIKILKCFEL